MSTNEIDADGIGPRIDLADVAIPADVGRRLQTLYGSDEPPDSAAEWVSQMRAAIDREYDRTPTVEDLCTTDDGAHAFRSATGDHRQEYVCVLDPIAYPYLTDTPGTITSVTPVRDTEVSVAVDRDGVTTSHDDAVVSIGVSDYVDQVERVSLEAVYRQVCGYVQTFEDQSEYEEWAETAEAATTSVSLPTGIGLAGALSQALFE